MSLRKDLPVNTDSSGIVRQSDPTLYRDHEPLGQITIEPIGRNWYRSGHRATRERGEGWTSGAVSVPAECPTRRSTEGYPG
jgi:hypothetical protein